MPGGATQAESQRQPLATSGEQEAQDLVWGGPVSPLGLLITQSLTEQFLY